MDFEYIREQITKAWDEMLRSRDKSEDDPMVSWRQRKSHFRVVAASKALQNPTRRRGVKKTNAVRRLEREAREAARNPQNLHEGFSR